MNKVSSERIAEHIQCDRESLAIQCRTLADRLIYVASKLNGDKPHEHLSINDLGEIQSQGTIIDASCGRLMGKIEVWGLMKESD